MFGGKKNLVFNYVRLTKDVLERESRVKGVSNLEVHTIDLSCMDFNSLDIDKIEFEELPRSSPLYVKNRGEEHTRYYTNLLQITLDNDAFVYQLRDSGRSILVGQ